MSTSKLRIKVSSRLLKKRTRKKQTYTKRVCRFCLNKKQEHLLDYKNTGLLKGFLTERNKILPARISGNCSFHQRILSGEIKISRTMALLPYCPLHM